jgi:hypothetical protein
MDLPPACSLDPSGLGQQRERYRTAGRGARVIERSPRRLVVTVGDVVSKRDVEELVAVESQCCPFFELGWEPGARRLSVAVPTSEHEPALDAIAAALGIY